MTKKLTKTAAVALTLAILVAVAVIPSLALATEIVDGDIRVEGYILPSGLSGVEGEIFIVEYWMNVQGEEQLIRVQTFNEMSFD